MIDKLDMLHQKNMMYPQTKTTITKLIYDNECFIKSHLITSQRSFIMLNNFAELYRRDRIFKIVGLQ